MNLKAAESQIEDINQNIASSHGQQWLVALLSGRLTGFVSLAIAGFIAVVFCIFLLWHPSDTNVSNIIMFLGIMGTTKAILGNASSIVHTYIASKAATPAPVVTSAAPSTSPAA